MWNLQLVLSIILKPIVRNMKLTSLKTVDPPYNQIFLRNIILYTFCQLWSLGQFPLQYSNFKKLGKFYLPWYHFLNDSLSVTITYDLYWMGIWLAPNRSCPFIRFWYDFVMCFCNVSSVKWSLLCSVQTQYNFLNFLGRLM